MRRKTLQQQLREIDFIEQKVIVIFPLLLSFSVENFLSYAPPQTSRAAFDLLCSPSSSSVCHKYLSVGVSLGLRLVSLIIFIP